MMNRTGSRGPYALATVAGAALLTCVSAAAAEPLRCKLIGNNTPREGVCTWELSWPNDANPAGPRGGTLYFNHNRPPAEPGPQDRVSLVEHINGDLFRLRLDLPPNDRPTEPIRFLSQGTIQNVSDAPAGFFLVQNDGSANATAVDLSVRVNLQVLAPEQLPSRAVDAESPAVINRSAPLLPQPVRYQPTEPTVDLTNLPIFGRATHEAAAQLIESAIGRSVSHPAAPDAKADPADAGIYLSVDPAAFDEVPAERRDAAYRLSVSTGGRVTIVGGGRAGLYYGAQSLVALIENSSASNAPGGTTTPECEILDFPHFAYRGLHLDVARNFQSLATVKKLLDLMAAYKLNRFHFHLTDDEGWRLAIDGLPELTEVGGRRGFTPGFRDALPPSFGSGASLTSSAGSGHYSRSEFVELLRYASARHIRVIPEIDLPGHARAAIRSMQVRYERLTVAGRDAAAEQYLLRRPDDPAEYASVQMWNDNVVDVRLPSTVMFVEHVVSDLAAMYDEAGVTLDSLHFGGDEVPTGCWGGDDPADADASHDLFAGFMKTCGEIAARHGARLAGWEEVFLESEQSEDSRPPKGVAYVWNNIWGWGQEDAAYRLANAGTDVVLCNATHLYFDLAYTRDPDEPGYYWAGTTDVREVFGFHPYDYFEGLTHDRLGNAIAPEAKQRLTRLDPSAHDHVQGIQGHLWGENLNSLERLEYMAFPRVLALAERAWHGPEGSAARQGLDRSRTWSEFSAQVQRYELPKLSQRHAVRHRPFAAR
ncbi:MAG: family 20 glycosylhydrolase [Planctomycetota bacterium]